MYQSVFFTVNEFRCRDGTGVPQDYIDTNLAALASQLDIVRSAWGSRVEVVSGYRTAAYNHAIKGAPKSMHVTARAADVRPIVVRDGHRVHWELLQREDRVKYAEDFYAVVQALMATQSLPLVGGIGWYPRRWVHLDVRPRPADAHVARWEGEGIGAEQVA